MSAESGVRVGRESEVPVDAESEVDVRRESEVGAGRELAARPVLDSAPQARPLEGRKALVTGAGVGIGLAAARALGSAGASVALHYYSHGRDAEISAEALRANGLRAVAIPADLSSAEEAVAVVDRAVEQLGGLDILVNNAGVTLTRAFAEIDRSAFDWLYALNVRAAFLVTQRALPQLAASGRGSVINISSTHGVAGFPGHSVYAGTKGALIAMTRELAIELAPQRVRVNAIVPGVIEVPRYFDIPGYTTELGATLSPLPRVGTPEDVASGILYLASDAASFVTGEVLFVDGGLSAKMALEWKRSDVPT